MPYTWFLIVGLALAGGVIAFTGDRLGRYMGKRRLTVFGLRPRHTALIFTVIGGMLIAMTSLVTMSLVSDRVRQAVFEVETLLRDRASLARQNRSLSQETARLLGDRQRAEERAHQAARKEAQSRRKLAQTEHARREAERLMRALQSQVAEQTRVVADKAARIRILNERIAMADQKLARVSATLVAALGRARSAEKRYRDARARYDRVAADLETARGSLADTNRELVDAQAERDRLRSMLNGLSDSVAAYREQIRNLEKAKSDLEQSHRDLQMARDELEKQVEALRVETARLAGESRASRQEANAFRALSVVQGMGEVIFAVGEELAWEVVDGRQPRARVRERIADLVERARAVAIGRGAAGPRGRPELSLVVARRYQRAGSTSVEDAFGTEAMDLVTEEIVRANTGVVAQIAASSNTVAGQPVVGYINTWINRLVFHDGEQIASRTVNARQSVGQVVEDLVALLQGEVRAAAVSRGMIPRSAVPGAAGAMQVGEVPLRDLVAAAERVRKQRGMANIAVLAVGDLWTADSMKVAFRIGPAPRTPSAGGSVPGMAIR